MTETRFLTLNDIKDQNLPKFVVVEGAIGVGKTTLSKQLAECFNYDILLEMPQENPFLERFYAQEKNAALSTQLYFLLQRAQQLNNLRQEDLFKPSRICDFLIDKDKLFAETTLDQHELELYLQIYQHLTIDVPKPDLVIYLQAPTDVLLERIARRGIESEQQITEEYLNKLNEAYSRFFHFYDASPLLIVNAADADWVNNPNDFNDLVRYIIQTNRGRHYYNPQPSI